MTCQCRFISCNKYTTLIGYVHKGEGCECVRARGMWKLYLLLNFVVNLNFSKNYSLLKKNFFLSRFMVVRDTLLSKKGEWVMATNELRCFDIVFLCLVFVFCVSLLINY